MTLTKTHNLETKLYNTNKFVHGALIDKRIKDLNTIKKEDIAIGDSGACVTMYVYSRFDCPACNDFFADNYLQLKNEFIDNGSLILVVRYLVHESKPATLFATKHSYYTHSIGGFDSYIDELNHQYPALDTVSISKYVLGLNNDKDALSNFVNNREFEKKLLRSASLYRNAEILSTPTIFINNQRLIGNRNYNKLRKVILNELNNNTCR